MHTVNVILILNYYSEYYYFYMALNKFFLTKKFIMFNTIDAYPIFFKIEQYTIKN